MAILLAQKRGPHLIENFIILNEGFLTAGTKLNMYKSMLQLPSIMMFSSEKMLYVDVVFIFFLYPLKRIRMILWSLWNCFILLLSRLGSSAVYISFAFLASRISCEAVKISRMTNYATPKGRIQNIRFPKVLMRWDFPFNFFNFWNWILNYNWN